jgi:uncharacterized protein
MIDLKRGARVYVDSNVWVYLIEEVEAWMSAIGNLLDAVKRADAQLVSSMLAWAECVYQPEKDKDLPLVAAYDQLFVGSFIDVIPMDEQLLLRAARRGGALGLKLLDAAHYIAAVEDGCEYLVSADRRFRSGPAMDVIVLDQRQ